MRSVYISVTKTTPESAARRWLLWEYGPSFSLGSNSVRGDNRESFNVDVEFTKEVLDRTTGHVIRVPTKLDNITTIEVDSKTLQVKAPTLGDVSAQVWMRFRDAQWSLEKKVLKAEWRQYGNLATAKQMFRPITRIIIQLKRKQYALLDNYEKNMNHVQLLKRAGFVTVDEDKIVPGVMYTSMLENINGDLDNLQSAVLGYLLSEEIEYITSIMKINAIRPYSKIPALYYDPARDLRRIIGMDEDTLYKEFCKSYRHTERDKFDQNLDDLISSKILNRDSNSSQVYGKVETLNEISTFSSINGVRALAC
jgi:hypothetical protein